MFCRTFLEGIAAILENAVRNVLKPVTTEYKKSEGKHLFTKQEENTT
jgi:hypothetical protein